MRLLTSKEVLAYKKRWLSVTGLFRAGQKSLHGNLEQADLFVHSVQYLKLVIGLIVCSHIYPS